MKNIFLVLLLLTTLSACTKIPTNDDLSLNLEVHHKFDENGNMGYYKDVYSTRIINDYNEYLESLLPEITNYKGDSFFKESFFQSNSLLIIPIHSVKNPVFDLVDYTINGSELLVKINQINQPIRNTQIDPLSLIYYLAIEVDSKTITKFDYEVVEKTNYFETYSLVLDSNSITESKYEFFEKLEDFKSIYSNITTIYGHEINIKTLLDDYVVTVISLNDYVGNHLIIEDAYLTNGSTQRYYINLSKIDFSYNDQKSDRIIVCIFDKSFLEDNFELIVNINNSEELILDK